MNLKRKLTLTDKINILAYCIEKERMRDLARDLEYEASQLRAKAELLNCKALGEEFDVVPSVICTIHKNGKYILEEIMELTERQRNVYSLLTEGKQPASKFADLLGLTRTSDAYNALEQLEVKGLAYRSGENPVMWSNKPEKKLVWKGISI